MNDKKIEELKEVKLTLQEKSIADIVLNRVKDLQKDGGLHSPANYSCSNALKSAWLILQDTLDKDKKPVLQTCTQLSIMNSLLDMVIQGLSPVKKQCYFIAYGNVLKLSRSYMGTVAVTKRLKGIKDVKAYCIYEGDEFEQEYDLDTATLKITKFNPKFENIDITKIKGAFAVVVGENGPIHTEVMNITQIRMAWSKSKTGGQVHKDFAEEMAKKSVINRACKMFANTSDDSDVLIEAFNNSDEKTYDENDLVGNVEYEVKEEVKQKANSKPIDIKEAAKPIDIKKENIIEVENIQEQSDEEGPDF